MTMFDWHDFVARWSEALLQTPDIAQDLSPDVVASGWVGNPGATEEQIGRLEAHLGTSLPPSYHAFLQTSNGWRWDGIPLLSTEEIEWLSVGNQQFIDDVVDPDFHLSDDDYFVYGLGQTPMVRAEDVPTTLQISDWVDTDIYLLNPRVTTKEGEWEAWHYASYRPGFRRYRSFQELMQSAYDSFVRLNR